jgi:hypothetical protein
LVITNGGPVLAQQSLFPAEQKAATDTGRISAFQGILNHQRPVQVSLGFGGARGRGMSFFPDMGRKSLVAAGDHVRAIGWLHPDHPYTKGEVPAGFVARLKEFAARSGKSAGALYFGAFGGFHMCEFCGRARGISNFGVPSGDLLFVAPEMVVHYIQQHGYCPPAEFLAAVLRSPLPDREEYQIITEPFWHLHRDVVRRTMQAAANQPRD